VPTISFISVKRMFAKSMTLTSKEAMVFASV